jgi:hypothetical protein
LNNIELKKEGLDIEKGLYIKNDNTFFIYDEIDTIIDPLKSELNIPINEQKHDNFNFISTHIIQIVNNYYNIQTKQTSLDISTLSTVSTTSSLTRSSNYQNDDILLYKL